MSNPRTYVTWRDLHHWGRDLVLRFAGVLDNWSDRDGLGKVPLAIAALTSLFCGLRSGAAGAGVQMNAKWWARILGCSERAVTKAFRVLERRHWGQRRRRLIEHDWGEQLGTARWVLIDPRQPKRGRIFSSTIKRRRADVHGVFYLLPLGQVRVHRNAGELVAQLRKSHGREIRTVAKRIADFRSDEFRPFPSGRTTRQENRKRDAGSARDENFPLATGPPPRTSAVVASRRSAGGIEGRGARYRAAELERLWSSLALTPSQAWPSLWYPPFGDEASRRWLQRDFAQHYRPELLRRVAAVVHQPEVWRRLQQNADEDLARARAAPAQLSQRARVLRDRLIVVDDSPESRNGFLRYLTLNEHRKTLAAKRAAGELEPKRRVRPSC